MQTTNFCFVCNTPHNLEEHHLVEQAKGGTNNLTRWLCISCHDAAHKQARARLSKNKDVNRKIYGPSDNRAKFEFIVRCLLLGRQHFEMERDTFANHAIMSLTIPVSPNQMNRLKIIAKAKGLDTTASLMLQVINRLTGLASKPKDSPPDESQ